MSAATATPPPTAHEPFGGISAVRRFSVEEYHRLIDAGIFTEQDRVELLDGYLIEKDMVRPPEHDGPMDLFEGAIAGLIPPGWFLRIQRAVTLSNSEPEPDYAIVRGTRRDYLARHPGPDDIGLLVEVSHTSLGSDLSDKVRIYGAAGIPFYWVIDTINRKVIVFAAPDYSRPVEHPIGSKVPLIIAGRTIGHIAVSDLL
jgi:Uma2 family endonuclease